MDFIVAVSKVLGSKLRIQLLRSRVRDLQLDVV